MNTMLTAFETKSLLILLILEGSYSLVRDDDLGQCEFGLDARVCFNVASSWDAAHGGQTIYIARLTDIHNHN